MAIKVRRATSDDLNWMIGQLKSFSEFFGTERQLFKDEEHTRLVMQRHLDGHLLLVAEKEEVGPVGFIAGLLSPHFYNPDITVLAESFWWVAPEHRGSRAGLILLNEFVEHGKEIADWITLSLQHHSPVKDVCLTRRGFRVQEHSYLLEVN
jgi:RimJ/RimL family protein N-acetyltransferase